MMNMLEKFSTRLALFPEKEKERILSAAEWSKELHQSQNRASGEPYFIHPLQVAEILIDLNMDSDTIIAALLHDILEDTDISIVELRRRYGKQVAALVDGVTKISELKTKTSNTRESETIRKMLFAMIKDIRVIIIKLADKYHNMSTLEYLPPEKRKSIATECLEIYAPLANRLGISWMRTELEDLSLKHLHPDTYRSIKEFVTSRKGQRASYLKKVERTIIKAAKEEKIDITVNTRAKHFYSIYQKMKRRKKSIEEIYDILGIRVLCSTTNECYTLLGVVHKLWPPIEGRFKDYIAMPKTNQYQSLHTTVMCYDGKLLEIQIRTQSMHSTAEYGVAAHWLYKTGIGGSKNVTERRLKPEQLPLINKLKKWNQDESHSDDFLEEIKGELLRDTIYVFTPKGQIVELPSNSTALDFAYHIHTEVGNHCIGAKADGSIIPLNQPLKNTQVIEILTSNAASPHVNWLRNVRTSRARQKIRHWLNKHDETLFIDKSIIAKKKPPPPQPAVVPEPEKVPGKGETIIKEVIDRAKIAFRIGEEKNMMISIAGCCSPSTGDSIIGYVSRGRGIIVHKRSCPNLKHIMEIADRTVEVEWETVSPKSVYRFRVTSKLTSDLFSEIEGAVRKYHGHLIEGRLEENNQGNLQGSFTMELDRNDDFKKVMKSLRTIPSVVNIHPISS